jgi:hypothetical protein
MNITYWVTGDVYVSGTLTLDAGCVVKFNAYYLLAYGSVVCNGTSSSPSILTSSGDYVYGDPISPGNYSGLN